MIRVSSNRPTRRPREKARRTLVVTESLSSEARVVRRHDGCDDATSRAGGARGDIRGDRVVATAARAPQRASVDVVVLHLASAGPAPDSHEEVGAGARRTHALALARRERGRETTGEPSAHALPRRTRACALARRTRALALARRALALARGRAAFRDGREGCFLPRGTTPRVGRPAERVYTPSSFARRTRSAAIPRWRAARAAACVCSWTRSRRASRATCSWRRRWTWACRSTPCASSSRRFPRHPHPRDPRPRPSPHPSGATPSTSCTTRSRASSRLGSWSPRTAASRSRCATTPRSKTCSRRASGCARACARARAAVLCCARRGRGGGARDGRGGSTLPRGRGGGQRG